MALDPGVAGGGAVRFSVANQKTRFGVDGPATEEIQNHPRRGFAPVAGATILGKYAIGVKRAIADVVEMGSRQCELRRELRMEGAHIILTVEPAGDSSLVGHDEYEESRVVEQFDGRLGTVDPAKTRI